MKKIIFCLILMVFGSKVSAQFSKERALYKAKEFVIKSILKSSEDIVEFEIDPLAASSSGELTSLAYSCKKKNIEGLILGFSGQFWNDNGVNYTGYTFRNLTKDEALKLLQKIDGALKEHKKFINDNIYDNNIYFDFEDLTFNISSNLNSGYHIRVFWNEYDAEWTNSAFNRTKKRFEKRMEK